MTEKPYVFISYSSKDIHQSNAVVKMLKEAGIEYWRAPEMIPAGSNYAREIPQAITACQAFVLLISGSSQSSIWVEKEIDCAVNSHRVIVPLRLDEEPLNDVFRFYLNNVQSIFYSSDKQHALQLLKERLEGLLNAPEETQDTERRGDTEAGENGADAFFPDRISAESMVDSLLDDETRRKNYNTLQANAQPIKCKYCGGELKQISMGTYLCKSCNRENYDSYHTVRNFLEKHGAHSILEIQHATGIPRNVIRQFLEDERLEIPRGSSVRITCRECGIRIRTGSLCEACKARSRRNGKRNLGY